METHETICNAVKLMRDIRDGLNREFEKMSFEEEKEYIQKHLIRPISQDNETPFTGLSD